jgi:predicted O-methyltransferase YrrM
MSQPRWSAVEDYLAAQLIGEDQALDAAVASSAAAGLPPIAVSPSQGKLLHLLVRATNTRTVLELGTLGGYSTIWLARALPPEGRLLTVEIDPSYAAVARTNLERAGLLAGVELRVEAAGDALAALIAQGSPPFDLIFIDADKPSIPEYFERALELTHAGSIIIVDNVIRGGHLIDADSDDGRVRGARRLHELLAREPRVSATTIQTVGSKGYDGFTLAIVGSE